MERIVLIGESWSSGHVRRARGFVERWRGLRGSVAGDSLLLRTRSVHSFGLERPFVAVGLTDDLRVVTVRAVTPRRVAYFPGCRWVLELPADTEPPPVGAFLEMTHA